MRLLAYCILLMTVSMAVLASSPEQEPTSTPAPLVVVIRENLTPEQLDSLVDREADRVLADCPLRGHFGYCHTFWQVKKRIYKEKYHMDWRSPADENPDIIYD